MPPVIAMIRDEFALSATAVGLLSSIPPALFAIAALAGSLLVARLGVRAALVGGLTLVAAGSALRGLSTNYVILFATTIVMSVGVAIMQPIMPTTVRQWLPRRIGLGTAVYTNGLLVGEVFRGAAHHSLCAANVQRKLARVAGVLVAAGRGHRGHRLFHGAALAGDAARTRADAPAKWLPDWHKGLVWRLGGLFVLHQRDLLQRQRIHSRSTSPARAAPDLISDALLALNFGQVPASLLLLAVAGKLERRAWPYIASGILSLHRLRGAGAHGRAGDDRLGRAAGILRRVRADPWD